MLINSMPHEREQNFFACTLLVIQFRVHGTIMKGIVIAKHAQYQVWSSRVGKAWSRVTAKFGEISSAACLFHGSPCCALAADSEKLLHNYMNGTSVFCRLPASFPQCLIKYHLGRVGWPLKFILGLRSQLDKSPRVWDLTGIGISTWASKSPIQLI